MSGLAAPAREHVVITGGSSGIGKQSAVLFAAAGARVTVLARRPEPLAEAVADIADEARRPRAAVLGLPVDVRDASGVDAAVATARTAFGPIDVLVCCAGVAVAGHFSDLPLDEFRTMIDVNYFGTLHAVRAVLPDMRERGSGRLVLLASGAAIVGLFGYSAYGPSKFAVRGLAESLRAELAGTGVRVSVVYLPDVDTPQLAAENRTKPAELRAIAGKAKPWTARQAAELVVGGAGRRFAIAGGGQIRLLLHGHSVLAPLLRKVLDRIARRSGGLERKAER